MTRAATAARLTGFAALLLAASAGATDRAQASDDPAWAITEDLTTEIGPRPAGSDREAAARRWAVERLKAMGFANVREEAYRMPVWQRGEEAAWLTAPFLPQQLTVVGLGNSGATGAQGIEAEIVYFEGYDALAAAPDSAVKGKIVFVDNQMKAAQDGSGYGYFGRGRFIGPNVAAKKGALAIVIRSIGTDSHRIAHAGVTNFADGVTPIPAAALSNPDADQLVRQWRRRPGALRLKLLLTPRRLEQQASGNVIAEVPGSDPAASPVILACHLDSWDQGTGAIDDAAGCGIITAAAKHVMAAGQPRRTIRILWAGAEEVGGFGSKAYFDAHGKERHAAALESDFGADRVWRVDFKLPDSAKPLTDRIAAALAPLGITRGKDPASGGTDIGALVAAGTPVIDLQQDGTRYFDIHHTPDDTLDKVDPAQLRQNVAAWTATLAILANSSDSELP